jgi:hypothetical protein
VFQFLLDRITDVLEEFRVDADCGDTLLNPSFRKRLNASATVAEWSRAGTSFRLRKLAETLGEYARNAKRRQEVNLDSAIADWEEDLEFLFHKFHRGRFGFGWRGTAIRLSNRGAICGFQVELDFVFEEADVRHD